MHTEQFEGIYEVLNRYSIRSITYDGISESNAERILRMRPIPTNYAILATAQQMNGLLKQAMNYKIIEHPNRWRLIYLDFADKSSMPQIANLSPEITIFKPSAQMCCVYLSQSIDSNCECDGKTMQVRLGNIRDRFTAN